MQYRVFPKIPQQPISILGFGCMRLPTLGQDQSKIDEPRATQMLREAIDAGVNYVDTAYPYHNGQSEPFVGRALRDGYREKVMLATKHPVWMVKSQDDWDRYLDEQLKKLGTDHIDFYLLHALNSDRWETVLKLGGLASMERAKADGRIKHLGFSFHGPRNSFKTIVDGYDWEFCQIQYNFLDEEFQAGTEGLQYAAERKVGVIVMEPLRGGALVKAPEPVQAIWDKAPVKRTPVDWALRWIWDHPEVVTVLSGMNAKEQVDENMAIASDVQAGALRAEEKAIVSEVCSYYQAKTQVPCTNCGYCQPCPNGVFISDVFSMHNSAVMFNSKAVAAMWYKGMYVPGGHGADACTGCGECEPQCPQSIAIIDKLKEAHEHLMG